MAETKEIYINKEIFPCIHQSLSNSNSEITLNQVETIIRLLMQFNIPKIAISDFFKVLNITEVDGMATRLLIDEAFDFEQVGKVNKINCREIRENFEPTKCSECIFLKPKDDKEINTEFQYPTSHLKGFDDLRVATALYGQEYMPALKALWYNLLSISIATFELQLGQIRTDGRISVLFPIKSGKGKKNIKTIIKACVTNNLKIYSEPTSLHPEQLVGKTLEPKKGSDNYRKIKGYLADDYVVIDEAYSLLNSNDMHYAESRRYIRFALDSYPNNTITKRMTSIKREEALSYQPKCVMALFVQPFKFNDDSMVLEGDMRRYLVPYTPMTGINRKNAYKNRIFDEPDSQASLKKFGDMVNTLDEFEKFEFTEKAKFKFFDLSSLLINFGFNYSEKIRNFTDHIDFTIQDIMLKFTAIQALQNNTNTISVKHVEYAFIDLIEQLKHTFIFIEDKIPGMMDYGDEWQGARKKDQECLRWLEEQDALSLESTHVSISGYKSKIMEIFNVKERTAIKIKHKHVKEGWIEEKKGKHESFVWLGFKPLRDARVANGMVPESKKIISEYYKIINK